MITLIKCMLAGVLLCVGEAAALRLGMVKNETSSTLFFSLFMPGTDDCEHMVEVAPQQTQLLEMTIPFIEPEVAPASDSIADLFSKLDVSADGAEEPEWAPPGKVVQEVETPLVVYKNSDIERGGFVELRMISPEAGAGPCFKIFTGCFNNTWGTLRLDAEKKVSVLDWTFGLLQATIEQARDSASEYLDLVVSMQPSTNTRRNSQGQRRMSEKLSITARRQ